MIYHLSIKKHKELNHSPDQSIPLLDFTFNILHFAFYIFGIDWVRAELLTGADIDGGDRQ